MVVVALVVAAQLCAGGGGGNVVELGPSPPISTLLTRAPIACMSCIVMSSANMSSCRGGGVPPLPHGGALPHGGGGGLADSTYHPGSRGRDMNTNETRASAAWPGEGSTRFLPLSFYKKFFSILLRGVISLLPRYTHTPNFSPLRLTVAEKNGYGQKNDIGSTVYITLVCRSAAA